VKGAVEGRQFEPVNSSQPSLGLVAVGKGLSVKLESNH